jgi:hypothetical protein
MFFVRSKARALKMRDPETGKMLNIGPRQWVPFDVLPRGTTEQGGCDVEVRQVKTQEDLSAIEAENKLAADADSRSAADRSARTSKSPAPVEPSPEAIDYEPHHEADQARKRKGHR